MTPTRLSSTIGPDELELLARDESNVRLLDVRTPGEFESAHIPGAYNVPLDLLGEHTREIRNLTGTQIVLICQSGQRAGKADDALRAAGMSNLHVLEGGMNGWLAGNRESIRGRKRISLERQVRILAGALAGTGGFLALLIHPGFAIIPAMIGSGLVFAGVSDTCAMGMLLAKLGYNRPASCDPAAAVRALTSASPAKGPSFN